VIWKFENESFGRAKTHVDAIRIHRGAYTFETNAVASESQLCFVLPSQRRALVVVHSTAINPGEISLRAFIHTTTETKWSRVRRAQDPSKGYHSTDQKSTNLSILKHVVAASLHHLCNTSKLFSSCTIHEHTLYITS
jgi:hypothetical protein